MFPNFFFVCGHKLRGDTAKSVMNVNGVQIYDLLNEDAELSAGKLSENNSDIRPHDKILSNKVNTNNGVILIIC
jgi:hypothetical protein